MSKYFEEVDSRVSFQENEENILKFWEKEEIFKKQLEKTKDGEKFVMYDGPPTANGKPHLGHVLTRIFKDVFPRYKSMQGYFVLRKAGWDTHGLPVEVQVEKSLGIKKKEEIEELVEGDKKASIEKFNKLCKESVWEYIDLWEKMVKRVGHWIDMEDPYITYENDYIESVWWSLKQLHNKGLLYKGYKVVPYCIRCGTPLSSHELSQDYQEKTDTSVYVKFKIKDEDAHLIAWTTTPWTLPGNVGLAVDENIDYVYVKVDGETLIISQKAAERLNLTDVLKVVKGKDLIGKKYGPPFAYLAKRFPENEKLHTVMPADFVQEEEGSGIIHTAVMYGEEDFDLGKKYELPTYHLVNKQGKFVKEAKDFSGLEVFEANEKIIRNLESNNKLLKKEEIKHQYPHCWRCHNPLIYYALESWFIKTTQFKKELISNNNTVNWVPNHVKNGRMRNWYETLIDWSLSRNRYWGTPLPVWSCTECDNNQVIGSIKELKELSVDQKDWKNLDLHRPYVDEIQIKCNTCGRKMVRVEEVIDVWYDSGAMQFAQWNYPHKNPEKFEKEHPADFISEGIDQTRGWFFSLQAISTLLFGKSAYKNVVTFEHALDDKGKKMSKSLGNVVDPMQALEEAGADAIRWFFFSSVSIGKNYRVSIDTLKQSARDFLIPLWNSYKYLVMYANQENWRPDKETQFKESVLDKWIISRLNNTIKHVTEKMNEYDTYSSTNAIQEFVLKDVSQWYIRRSRGRKEDAFFASLHHVLVEVCKLMAPMSPFNSDLIYKNLTKETSVHLAEWPKYKASLINTDLEKEMEIARKAVELAHAARKEAEIKVRQPLNMLKVSSPVSFCKQVCELIKEETNVLNIELLQSNELSVYLDTNINDDLKMMGEAREVTRKIQNERKKMGTSLDELVDVVVTYEFKQSLIKQIKSNALVRNLQKGDKFEVKKINE